MKTLRLLAITVLFASGLAAADTVKMSGISADANGTGPTRGMTQSSVEANFGAPASKRAPVGDPPISRWEYDGFVVFFEYDKVIHTVKTR
jgi:hypothetical protein